MIDFMRTTDLDLYYIFVLVGTALVIIWNMCQINKMKQIPGNISKNLIKYTKNRNIKFPVETITAVVELVIITLFQYILAGNYNIWFGKIIDMGPNYFGTALIGPFVVAAICLILGIDIIRAYDLIAPSYAFGLIAAKFGCFCAGCCRGFEWEHGLYNYGKEQYEFPVQLVEMGLALIIFIILVSIRKKAKPGTLFPIYLILYSSTRFISEFTRVEKDIVGNLKLYHLCCLAGIAFGVVFLLIALFLGDKVTKLFTWNVRITDVPRSISAEISYDYHNLKNKVTKKDKKVIHHNKKHK